MKTILFVGHTAKMGGGEIALLNLVTTLDQGQVTPVVALASEGPLADKLRAAGIETYVLPLSREIVETRKDKLGIGSLLYIRQISECLLYATRLARFARERGADVIHSNSLKADLYGGLAAWLAGIPVLWHIRDHIDAQYLPRSVAGLFRLLARAVPQIVVTNSESTRQRLNPSSHSAKRVYVVHDGYNHKEFQKQQGVVTVNSNPVVALIGRIAPWKGQHVFLEAAAQVLRYQPSVRFWIVGAPLFGEQDYECSLRAQTHDLGIEDQVEFLGFQEDIPSLLAKVDMVVHASILGEPFGQVVIEGMAAGKPVIATKGGALPEIVVEGKTGMLVPMGEAAPMAEAISTLLADPSRAQAMGLAGRKRVQECFTITDTARKLESIYDQLLTKRRPRVREREIKVGVSERSG